MTVNPIMIGVLGLFSKEYCKEVGSVGNPKNLNHPNKSIH